MIVFSRWSFFVCPKKAAGAHVRSPTPSAALTQSPFLLLERLVLLLQVPLVRLNVPGPLAHGPTPHLPDLFRDLPDQPKVVRDEHHAAVPLVDGVRQGVDRLHVQVVGGCFWVVFWLFEGWF